MSSLIFILRARFCLRSQHRPGRRNFTPCGVRIKDIDYADDIGQLSKDARVATDRLTRLDQHSKPVDLEISGVKTKSTTCVRDVKTSATIDGDVTDMRFA